MMRWLAAILIIVGVSHAAGKIYEDKTLGYLAVKKHIIALNLTVCNDTILNNLVVEGNFDICGVPACQLVDGYALLLTATSADIPHTLILRDTTGSFYATTITITGVLELLAADGDTVTLQPDPTTDSYLFQLPPNSGSNGYVLSTDGTGVTSWIPVSAAGASGITDLNGLLTTTQFFANGYAGIQPAFNSAINTHTLNIPLASTYGVLAGLISSTDYYNFKNTYTTLQAATPLDIPNTLVLRDNTGSFAATNVSLQAASTNKVTLASQASTSSYTFQFPPNAGSNEYLLSTDGTGVTAWLPISALGGLSDLNGLTTSTQFFANGYAGIQPAFNSAINTHTLNIPLASTYGVLAGLITSTDYYHFQNTYTTIESALITIVGDTGSVTGSAVSLKANATAGYSVTFTGSGTAMKLNTTNSANSTYIGNGAGNSASQDAALGYGAGSRSGGGQFVALGFNAFTGNRSNAIGYNASVSSNTASISIGAGATSGFLAIGAQASAPNGSAIGYQASSSGGSGTVVGAQASSVGTVSTAIGMLANTPNANAVAIGFSSAALGVGSIAIGKTVTASAPSSIMLGGISNTVTGTQATVIGGNNNSVSGFNSYALGQYASASNNYSFVYSDSAISPYSSHTNNSFNVRAAGGAYFDASITTTGVINFVTNGNTLTLQPNTSTTTYPLTLPPNSGTTNYALTTDGTGITSWQAAGTVNGGITTLNGLTTSTQFFANGYAGIQPAFNSAINTHTLNIPLASTYGVLAGLITSTDYYNFQNTYTTGAPIVTIVGDTGSVTGSAVSLTANTTAGYSVTFTGANTKMVLNATNSAQNTFIGNGAGYTSTSNGSNVALGYNTGINSNGNSEITIGAQSGNPGTGTPVIGYASGGSSSTINIMIGPYSSVSGSAGFFVQLGCQASGDDNSVAVGYQATAGPRNSSPDIVALGSNASAYGSGSTAVGYQASTAGSSSVGIGASANAPSASAVGVGYGTQATTQATALGYLATATGTSSVALGANALAAQTNSIAIGNTVTASAPNSIILGGISNTVTGTQATVMGGNTNSASGFNSYALGQYASASNNYSFVYSDSAVSPYSSHAPNSFNVRAAGGAYFDASITTTGVLNFVTNGNTLTLQPNTSTTTYPLTLPPNSGTTNYALTTDGTGITSWQAAGTVNGGITTLNGLTTSTQFFANGYAGIQPAFNSAINTHTLNIPLASTYGVLAGLITSTDYYNFQNTYTTGAPIVTIVGDTGSVTGAAVSLKAQVTSGATVTFTGSNTKMVLNVTSGSGTSSNTFMGNGAGFVSSSNGENTSLGYQAGPTNSGGTFVALGFKATSNNRTVTIGSNSIANATSSLAIGAGATASSAVVIGAQASASGGAAIGYQASSTGSSSSTAVGAQASSAGSASTAIGMLANTPNANAVAIGFSSAALGVGSIAIGSPATASALNSIMLGGISNTVTGTQATVIGGNTNSASGFNSYALGQYASATNNYSFVYSDSAVSPYLSHTNNSFNVRAAGGAYFDANITTTGVLNFVTNGNTLTLQPNTSTNTYPLTLPPNSGTTNYALTTDGTGITSWQAAGIVNGGITTLNGLTTSTQFFANGFAGIQPTFNSAINTHTLNIPLASTYGVLAGLITSTDYYNFQNTYTTIAAAAPIITIVGDTGSVTGSAVSLTANTTAGNSMVFSGAGTTMKLNTTKNNTSTYMGNGAGPAGTDGSENTVLGYNATSSNGAGVVVALGFRATTGNRGETAGYNSAGGFGYAATGGFGAYAKGAGYGYAAAATGSNSIAIGSQASSAGSASIAIGMLANTPNANAVGVGYATQATTQATTLGCQTTAGTNAVAIGYLAAANGTGSIAIGSPATASAPSSIMLGGISNTVTGTQATVIGGNTNSASGFNSYALGQYASASNNYSFVYSDSAVSPYSSHTPNSFNVRATGGAYFDANITTTGVLNFVTNGNTLTLQPNTSTNTYSLTLPPNSGSLNYLLTTDGTGNTSWQATNLSLGGLVTLNSLTTSTQFFANGFAGIQPAFNSAINTHTLNIPLASTYGVLAGLITSTDYYNFQNTYTTIAAAAPIITIVGDTGSVSGAAVSLKANATAGFSITFTGANTKMVLNVTNSVNNTFIGKQAGNSTPSTGVVSLGYQACGSLTADGSNLVIGFKAASSAGKFANGMVMGATTSQAIGVNAGMTVVGFAIGQPGNNATAIGSQAAVSSPSGSTSVALGYAAGGSSNSGGQVTTIGANAFGGSATNTIIGYALSSFSSNSVTRIGNSYIVNAGSNNIFAGINAGNTSYTSGVANNNSALGVATLSALTTGTNNTALGAFALSQLTTGTNTIAIGIDALSTLTNVSNAIGIGQLTSAQTGAIAIGNQAAALAPSSIILGGISNTVTGTQATVIGGNTNSASGFNSYALGQYASATNNYSFVYSDSAVSPYSSHAPNSFNVRAAGGAYFDASITTTGAINFATNNNTLTLQPNTGTSTYSLTLPPNSGSLNYLLTTDGTGNTSWQATSLSVGGLVTLNGLITSTQFFANGYAGIQPAFNSLNDTHTLNIPLASTYGVLAGLITSTDYYNFQNTYTTIAAHAPIITIVGDTGSVSGTKVFLTANGTFGTSTTFNGSGTKMTLNPTNSSNGTFIGKFSVTSGGTSSTVLGYASSSGANALGINCLVIGFQAFQNPHAGGSNAFIGATAGITSSFNNNITAVGYAATTNPGNFQVGIGSRTSVVNNGPAATVIGFNSGTSTFINNGNGPVIIGANSGQKTDTINGNIVIGQGIAGLATDNSATRIGNNYIADSASSMFVGQNAGNLVYTGIGNIGIGQNALSSLTTGTRNTVIGVQAGQTITSGVGNTLVGQLAGSAYTSSQSNNIIIGRGVAGTAGESNVIRVGSAQTSCYVTGINGATSSGGTAVLVNSSNQLGTTTSSEKFKENISDMDDYSSTIMQLSPVLFNYKTSPEIISSGLIAEEVAKIMPQLVYYDAEGLPYTVQYHDLPALLLNELQKTYTTIQTLQHKSQVLQEEVQSLRAHIDKVS